MAQGWEPFVRDKKDRLKYIVSDHTPFHAAGIPACILIDIDYPQWHTQADLPEAMSAGVPGDYRSSSLAFSDRSAGVEPLVALPGPEVLQRRRARRGFLLAAHHGEGDSLLLRVGELHGELLLLGIDLGGDPVGAERLGDLRGTCPGARPRGTGRARMPAPRRRPRRPSSSIAAISRSSPMEAPTPGQVLLRVQGGKVVVAAARAHRADVRQVPEEALEHDAGVVVQAAGDRGVQREGLRDPQLFERGGDLRRAAGCPRRRRRPPRRAWPASARESPRRG